MFLFILSDVSLRESEKLYNSFNLPLVSCRGDNMMFSQFSIMSCNFSRPVSLSLTVFAPCFYSYHPEDIHCSPVLCRLHCCLMVSYALSGLIYMHARVIHLMENYNKKKLCRLHCCLMVSYALSGLIYMHARVIHLMENYNKKKINLCVLSMPFSVFFLL